MNENAEAVQTEDHTAPSDGVPSSPVQGLGPQASRTAGLLMDIDLPIRILFGSAKLRLKDILRLKSGSVIELDRDADDQVEIMVNNRIIARGRVVILDGNYGVRITEILKPINGADPEGAAPDLLRLARVIS